MTDSHNPAANRLSPEFVDVHAEINFNGMRRQRNYVAHRYDVVDDEIVWNTIAFRFPQDARLVRYLLQRRAD